jgi:hypothetical protein
VFGCGPATRIYLAPGATDMRKGPVPHHVGVPLLDANVGRHTLDIVQVFLPSGRRKIRSGPPLSRTSRSLAVHSDSWLQHHASQSRQIRHPHPFPLNPHPALWPLKFDHTIRTGDRRRSHYLQEKRQRSH